MNPLLKDIFAEAKVIISLATEKDLTIGTAESCTGGLIGGAITALPGSSVVFKGGIIAYHNAVKHKLLNIPAEIIQKHGAVSQEVAKAMAKGAMEALDVDVTVSVTGIAGPGGGSENKPIGTVWMGLAIKTDDKITVKAKLYNFGDIGRNRVRDLTCYEALKIVSALLITASQ